jgi:phosphoribosylformimino-5-aminoimidazole carboxamide ribotide isomerase
MQLIPSIDLRAGRSRLVFWPGAASGSGVPTDRPEQIARHFVDLGAPVIHLVDLDGAARGAPVATAAVAAVARAVAVPLQLAGGVDGPDQVELAFAAGATRVVVPLWRVVEAPAVLAACLKVAGDWLAVGMDGRPERLADYPWQAGRPPSSLNDVAGRLLDAGVRRIVLSHWQPAGLARLAALVADRAAELQLAGGVSRFDQLLELRDAGVSGLIVGEALFNGAVDYGAALAKLRPVHAAGAA